MQGCFDPFHEVLHALAAADAVPGELGYPGVNRLLPDVAPAPTFPGSKIQLPQPIVQAAYEVGSQRLQGLAKRGAALQRGAVQRNPFGQHRGQLHCLSLGRACIGGNVAHAIADTFGNAGARVAHQPESHAAQEATASPT